MREGKPQVVPASGPDVAPARVPPAPERASRTAGRSPLVALGAVLAIAAGIAAVAFMALAPQGSTAAGAHATAAEGQHGLPGGAGDVPLAASSGNSTTSLPLPAPALPDLPVAGP